MQEFAFKHGFDTIEKKWGREEIVISNDLYCFKRLVFKKGQSLSMHFHVDKHETWEIISGQGLFQFYDYSYGLVKSKELSVGDVVTIPNFQLHRFTAHKETIINEVSTKDRPEDSYRTLPSGEFIG